jgi:hypothetical protein
MNKKYTSTVPLNFFPSFASAIFVFFATSHQSCTGAPEIQYGLQIEHISMISLEFISCFLNTT